MEEERFREPSIHTAVWSNNIAAVEKLLSEGIDVNTVWGWAKKSPLDIALEERFQEIALLLIERGGKLNRGVRGEPNLVLHIAAGFRCEIVVESLLRNGFDVNELSDIWTTPLHMSNGTEITEMLLANGARIHAEDKCSNTPISTAVLVNHPDTVECLALNGADVNLCNIYGSTPLHKAVHYPDIQRTEMVKILLAHGANVNARTNKGRIPLHCLPENLPGEVELVEEILKHDVEINAQDQDGLTPLHRALHCAEIVRMYLMKGANIDIKSKPGETPLERAQRLIQEFKPTGDNDWLNYNLQLSSEYLVRSIIKLRVAGLYVSKNNINLADCFMGRRNNHIPTSQLIEYDQQCRLESYELKLNVGLSLKDFIATKYPSYIASKELCGRLETLNSLDYPIYGDLIQTKFKRDRGRFTLLESCGSLFARSKAEPTLPEEIWKEILSNLDDTDLEGVLNEKPGTITKN